MANNTKKVYVYENDGELRVHPATVEADGSGTPDKLIFHNFTTEDLVFCFGPKALHANDPIAVSVEKGKKSQATSVNSQGGGNGGVFVYQVIAPKTGKKAKGNSDPLLIVEN